ncbi:methyltransferase domain-containing protein [Candidatus Omnitrophota bacterium]
MDNYSPSAKKDKYFWSEFSTDDMRNLVAVSREKGWRFSLENIIKPRSPDTYDIFFDNSRADWRFLTPLDKNSVVLDSGAGWGALSFSLSEACGAVYALDAVPEKVEFMKARAGQESISNINPVCGDILALPFSDNHFDMVILNGVLEWAGMADKTRRVIDVQKSLLSEAFRVLKKGGYLYIGIENRFAAIYILGWRDPHVHLRFISLLPRWLADIYCLLAKGAPYRTHTHSLSAYTRLLSETGFAEIKPYSPFPSYRRFTHIIPLDNPGILKYYVKNLVRPKTPSQAFFVNSIRALRLYKFIRFLVPDYSIIAIK